MEYEMEIRQPAVSGMFYPSDPDELSNQVDRFLTEHTEKQVQGDLIGLVVPHAGYVYSGYTAASAYALLKNRDYSTIIIISPSHREYFDGVSVYDGDAYSTPLGILKVDTALRQILMKQKGTFLLSKRGHREEHAIEVQLPFIQRSCREVKILPIVMGEQSIEHCVSLATALAATMENKNALLVASSDLSHMHSDGVAKELDKIVANHITSLSPMLLAEDIAFHKTEACGGGPIITILIAAKQLGANKATILHQCTSGDVTDERFKVVGYLAAAITKTY